MSDKQDQKKKDGHRQDKQHKAMREAVAERHRNAAPPGETHDRGDYVQYKKGSENDRTHNVSTS